MSDGEALLQAILDDPSDEVSRLAYADWMEEAGEAAWARAMRFGTDTAQIPSGALTFNNSDPFNAWFRHNCDGYWTWRRGFVVAVRCNLAVWLAKGPEMVRRHPVERVEIEDRSPRWGDGTGTYSWLCCDSPLTCTGRAHCVGYDIYDHLAETEFGSRGAILAAVKALSAACLAWAKAASPSSSSPPPPAGASRPS